MVYGIQKHGSKQNDDLNRRHFYPLFQLTIWIMDHLAIGLVHHSDPDCYCKELKTLRIKVADSILKNQTGIQILSPFNYQTFPVIGCNCSSEVSSFDDTTFITNIFQNVVINLCVEKCSLVAQKACTTRNIICPP